MPLVHNTTASTISVSLCTTLQQVHFLCPCVQHYSKYTFCVLVYNTTVSTLYVSLCTALQWVHFLSPCVQHYSSYTFSLLVYNTTASTLSASLYTILQREHFWFHSLQHYGEYTFDHLVYNTTASTLARFPYHADERLCQDRELLVKILTNECHWPVSYQPWRPPHQPRCGAATPAGQPFRWPPYSLAHPAAGRHARLPDVAAGRPTDSSADCMRTSLSGVSEQPTICALQRLFVGHDSRRIHGWRFYWLQFINAWMPATLPALG